MHRNEAQILKYDYLAIKDYNCNDERVGSKGEYILSFENRSLKVSLMAKKIIDRFDGKSSVDEILQSLALDGISFSNEDLIKFVEQVMIPNGMVKGIDGEVGKSTNSMLWARFPIVESQKFEPIFKFTHLLFNKWVAIIVMVILAGSAIYNIGNILTSHQVVRQVNSVFIILISYISLAMHEIGHASAAYHYGVRCGKMGIGMYLFSMVFFVDVSNTWKIESSKRVVVDLGGVYFQLIVTIPLMIAAITTKNVGYSVASVSIMVLSSTNFFPFLKLDGYWLLVDLLHVENLSVNAFKVVKEAIVGKIKCSKTYLICSVLYVVSFVAMMTLGLYSAGKVIISREWISCQIKELGSLFVLEKYGEFFGLLNNLVIFLIPLLFLFTMIYKVFVSLIRGLVVGMKKK